MKTKKTFYIICIIIICIFGLAIGKKLYDEKRDYSSNEILGFKNSNFSSDNASISLLPTDETPETENQLPIASNILISEEVEEKLINSFNNATFKKYDGANFKYHYKVTFTLDSSSSIFWLNVNDGIVYVYHNTKNYVFEDDNDFLNTFKEAVK